MYITANRDYKEEDHGLLPFRSHINHSNKLYQIYSLLQKAVSLVYVTHFVVTNGVTK